MNLLGISAEILKKTGHKRRAIVSRFRTELARGTGAARPNREQARNNKRRPSYKGYTTAKQRIFFCNSQSVSIVLANIRVYLYFGSKNGPVEPLR